MAEENLKQKTASGLKWNTIHNLSMKGIQFLLMLFMARLLTPDDYGTIGLLAIFIQISNTFAESGLGMALVRKQNRTQTDLSTVFYFNIVVSTICYFVIFAISPWIADFYDNPIICPLLRVLALCIPLNSLNTILVCMMNYTMQFKKQAIISITHTIISGIVGLAMAFMGYGVWALVGQQLTVCFVGIILCWTLNKWRPTLEYSWDSFHELFGFSSKLLITRIIDTIYGNIYTIVIGKVFSPATLGHYSRAQNWAAMPSTNLVSILNNVTFASLSKIQDDKERLKSIYRKMVKTSAFLIFPLMMGLAAVSRPLIIFTIGAKWELCIKILHIICFMFMLTPIHSLNTNLIQVMGRSDLSLKLSIIGKVIAIVVLFASLPFGIISMCYLSILSAFIMLIINMYYISKIIDISLFAQLKDLLPSFLLSTFMYVLVYFSLFIFDIDYIQLIIGVTVGTLAYMVPAYLLKMNEFIEAKSIIRNIIKK